jgi:hypothetical protein
LRLFVSVSPQRRRRGILLRGTRHRPGNQNQTGPRMPTMDGGTMQTIKFWHYYILARLRGIGQAYNRMPEGSGVSCGINKLPEIRTMCKAVGTVTFEGITGELVIHRDGTWGLTTETPVEDGKIVYEEVRFNVGPGGKTVSESQRRPCRRYCKL